MLGKITPLSRDFGVAFWSDIVFGCTFENASNYNANVNRDDNTYVFDPIIICNGDADGNNTVNVLDLVAVSSDFGNTCP